MMGARLKALRELGGLTCKDVDRLAGLVRGHCWTIERRNGSMRIEAMRKVAELFGCTVGYFANAEGKRPTAAEVRRAVKRAQARCPETYAQQ